MRILATALVALAAVVWTAVPVEARSRTQQTQAQARTTTAPQAARATAPQTARATATRRAAAPDRRQARAEQPPRAQAASRSGTRQAAARSTGRQQAAASCRGRNCGSAPRQVSWQSGLAPATNEQAQACPAGTLATLARGHADIVRCMPL